jgi:hypothetical protein
MTTFTVSSRIRKRLIDCNGECGMLTGDFFELLEKLLRGVVYFLYNIIATAAAMLRRPVIGGFRLQRVHHDPSRRQMGGLTFLFLCFVLFYAIALPGVDASAALPEVADSAEQLRRAFAAGPQLDFDGLWPAIAAALASILVIDAVLRLALWIGMSGASQRRERFAGAAEFSMFPALVAYVAAFILMALSIRLLLFEDWAGWVALAVALPMAILPAVPPSIVILAAMRRPPARRRRQRFALAGLTAAVMLLLFTAVYAGVQVGFMIQEERERSEPLQGPAIRTLDCIQGADGSLQAAGLLELEKGGHATLRVEDIDFFLATPKLPLDGTSAFETAAATLEGEPGGRHVLVTPAEPRLLLFRGTAPPGQWQRCKLRAAGARDDPEMVELRRN